MTGLWVDVPELAAVVTSRNSDTAWRKGEKWRDEFEHFTCY